MSLLIIHKVSNSDLLVKASLNESVNGNLSIYEVAYRS